MNPPSQPAFVMLKWAMTRRSQMSEVLEDNQWLHGLIRKCTAAGGIASAKKQELITDPQTLKITNTEDAMLEFIQRPPPYLPSKKNTQHRRKKRNSNNKKKSTQKNYLSDLQNAELAVSTSKGDADKAKIWDLEAIMLEQAEGTFNLWKNYDMPERLRLDSAWRHLTDTSDAKIGRFMLELQVSLRSELKRSVTENKDSVSKLNRDKEEWEMYGLFQDCLRYAWDYNRKHIVQVFDHWNRTPEGGIKWNITFNVGSCTKLMNKKRLNTSIIWRTAVKAFLNDSIAEHGPKETTNNSNNAMP